jgi:glycosyltransferase involved in cell wall biosynthesis
MSEPTAVASPWAPPVVSERALRIGIDGEALRKPMSGVGRYVFHIGRELETLLPNARFFAYARGPADELELPSARWELRMESAPRWRKLPSMAWVKLRSARLIRADGLDLYWAGRTLLPPLAASIKSVSTVHDLNCLVVPQTMPFKHRWAHRLWFGSDLRGADHVVANSRGTARRLRDCIGIQAREVVCPGIEAMFVPLTAMAQDTEAPSLPPDTPPHSMLPAALGSMGLRSPYLLAVATLEPRKNLSQLLKAFTSLKREGLLPGHQLALIGAPGWGAPELQRELAMARTLDVICTGYVADTLMPVLYQYAQALVFPSLYEGFGMPVVEARACGTRVIVSDVPELREVAGPDGTVVALSVDSLRDGIMRSLAGPRPSGIGLAATHSWAQSARRMAHLFAEACP